MFPPGVWLQYVFLNTSQCYPIGHEPKIKPVCLHTGVPVTLLIWSTRTHFKHFVYSSFERQPAAITSCFAAWLFEQLEKLKFDFFFGGGGVRVSFLKTLCLLWFLHL